MTNSQHDIRRTLRRYALALACVVTVAAGVLLVASDNDLALEEVMAAIGLNLVASVIFATIFTVLSTRVQERLLYDALVEQNDRLGGQLVTAFNSHHEKFLPADVFPRSMEFSHRFNEAITHSLWRTNRYWFQGVSAKYVASRLHRTVHPPQQVRIAMLDPRADGALLRVASDRQKRGDPHREDRASQDGIRDEVLMSVVALFDCRHICQVEIALIAATGLTRVELMDDCVFVSWFHHPAGAQPEFPETFRFKAGSFFYDYHQIDFSRRFEIAEKRIQFDVAVREQELFGILEPLVGRSVTPTDIERWRGAYAEYMENFADHLETI